MIEQPLRRHWINPAVTARGASPEVKGARLIGMDVACRMQNPRRPGTNRTNGTRRERLPRVIFSEISKGERFFDGPLLNHQNTIVIMQRVDRLGELSDAQPSWLSGMPGMDVINKILAVFDESAALLMAPAELRPIGRMQVFAQIQTLLVNVREELLKRVDLLRHGMAAVVNQDINPGNLFRQIF